MIRAASVFEISCGETDRHTDKRRWKPCPSPAVDAGDYCWQCQSDTVSTGHVLMWLLLLLMFRADKEKQTLVVEIETVSQALDQANKTRVRTTFRFETVTTLLSLMCACWTSTPENFRKLKEISQGDILSSTELFYRTTHTHSAVYPVAMCLCLSHSLLLFFLTFSDLFVDFETFAIFGTSTNGHFEFL